MKVILVFVSSLNGKVTKWNNPLVKSWSSKEDQDYFRNLLDNSELIITGSNSYFADPLPPSDKHLIIVMSSHADDYKGNEIKGMVEFSAEFPTDLVNRFEAEGYTMMTVVGGPGVATCFLKNNLVDELWLTFEPKIFGAGKNLVQDDLFVVDLELISIEKVNDRGTLISKYSVIK